jgi:hypothetical protein
MVSVRPGYERDMNDTTSSQQSVRYDSGATTPISEDNLKSLRTYVSDMLALEKHIGQPLNKQMSDDDVKKSPEARSIVARIKSINDAHIAALESHLESLGGHAAPLKEGVGVVAGVFAAAIGATRKTKVTKDLRDDSTVMSHATICYELLHATALAMRDRQTADLAKRFLRDYAECIMAISKSIPTVVVNELALDGQDVDTTVDWEAKENVATAWQTAG